MRIVHCDREPVHVHIIPNPSVMNPIAERGPDPRGCANTELSAIIVSELREAYGIKYRKEKKQKSIHDKLNQRKIFNVPLDKLEMTDVILANGGITQVPLFVSDACQRILENVSTEGLFRKAGSTARQREIRAHLEGGSRLGKSHHVIDVANVLKLFFRELPEPILAPGNLQESVLRCLLCGERKVNAMLLSVLLLPTHSLNTLTFFMQFLLTVSEHSAQNRMTPENLAIIFTPGLMPLPELIPQRLTSHCKVVQMLIEQANHIGTVPRYILERSRLTTDTKAVSAQPAMMSTPGGHSTAHHPDTDKKKKKRRSGMFNGLRKIVGSAIGSNDELDRSSVEMNPSTPCVKQTGKKRKVLDATGLSAKKKKDVMALLPENGALLPATPMCLKNLTKKTRISLGGKRFEKKQPAKHALPDIIEPLDHHPVMERRWSVVGTGWPRKKSSTVTSDPAFTRNTRKSMSAALNPMFSPPFSSPSSRRSSTQAPAESSSDTLLPSPNSTLTPKLISDMKIVGEDNDDSDFMRISKSEYEAIKERVSAIETRISKEFHSVQADNKNAHRELNSSTMTDDSMAGEGSSALEQVVDKYERTLSMQTQVMGSPSTDQLAKRLSRELKIRRRSAEHQVIRSPSARKIGTMRRRSRENVRVSRNFSWHVPPQKSVVESIDATMPEGVLQPMIKASLKRGRPNTVQTGLRHPSPPKKLNDPVSIDDVQNQQWISGENFFSAPQTPIHSNLENYQPSVPATPIFVTTASLNEMKTPMLPPRRPLNFRTPLTPSNSLQRTPMLPPRSTPQVKSAAPVNKALLLTPLEDTQTGRASIARLRSQNAGMVAAKAKLFNAFVTDTTSEATSTQPTTQPIALPRESSAFALERFVAQNRANLSKEPASNQSKPIIAPRPSLNVRAMHNSPRKSMTPRRGTKNLNGIHRRQKLRLAKSPIKKASPMRLRHLLLDDTVATSSLVKNVTKTASPGGSKRRSHNHRHKMTANKNGFHTAMDHIINGSPSDKPSAPNVPSTPHIKPALAINSPRRLVKTPAPQRSTPIRLRNSPRTTLKLYRMAGGEDPCA